MVDSRAFIRALGSRAVAVTVVTASDEEGPRGFLGLSAAHVSMDPPTLLVSIGRMTSALPTVLRARHFAVNCLSREGAAVADLFAGKTPLKGAERFAQHEWMTLETGAPILRASIVGFDCVLQDVFERPDVIIALGQVVAVHENTKAKPLVSFRGGYI